MRKIIPSNNKNKTEMSVTILLAAEEILNELMRLENDEDTRLSATLSLYNEIIITSTTMTDTNNLIILGSGPAGYSAGIYAARAGLDIHKGLLVGLGVIICSSTKRVAAAFICKLSLNTSSKGLFLILSTKPVAGLI